MIFCYRTNVSTGAARPNPQGSFHYGQINVTQVYVLQNLPPVKINGKLRTTLNGISYVPPETPLRLADLFDKSGVYTADFPTGPTSGPPKMSSSIINATYKGFMEIVFQNNNTVVQTYHLDGYAFFIVGYVEKMLCSFTQLFMAINVFTNLFSTVLFYLYVHFFAILEWIMGCGLRIVEAHITNGMVSLGVQFRYFSVYSICWFLCQSLWSFLMVS